VKACCRALLPADSGRRQGALRIVALAPKRNLSLQQRARIARNVLTDYWRQLGDRARWGCW